MDAQETGVALVPHVFEHAVEQIVAAAGELWPGQSVRLGEQVPSVESYVHRISVGGRGMFAKYSVLGAPLVSMLRGAHGTWDRVLAMQRSYVQRRDGMLAREAGQLRKFAELGQLRVCPLAGYASGVLFTEAVRAGVALDELLLAEPHHATSLLSRAWAPLAALRTARLDGWPMIAETSIVDTFERRFLGSPNGVALGQLRRSVNPDVVAGLRYVARRLRFLPVTQPTTSLTFGDLAPEHIILTGAEPVYLDPSAHAASPVSDLARLVSRVLLDVMARASATSARRHILAGLTDLVREERSSANLAASKEWMVELLALIARDLANVLSTYLAAPPRFPLPRSVSAVVERADVVMPVIEHVVTGLVQRANPVDIWERLTGEVVES